MACLLDFCTRTSDPERSAVQAKEVLTNSRTLHSEQEAGCSAGQTVVLTLSWQPCDFARRLPSGASGTLAYYSSHLAWVVSLPCYSGEAYSDSCFEGAYSDSYFEEACSETYFEEACFEPCFEEAYSEPYFEEAYSG